MLVNTVTVGQASAAPPPPGPPRVLSTRTHAWGVQLLKLFQQLACSSHDLLCSNPLLPPLAALQAGAIPNIKDGRGRTPLEVAIECGRTQSVLVLLQGGANPSVVDGNGDSYLHSVAAKGQVGRVWTRRLGRAGRRCVVVAVGECVRTRVHGPLPAAHAIHILYRPPCATRKGCTAT